MAQTKPTGSPVSRVQHQGRGTSWEAALLQTPERTAPLYRAIYAALLEEPLTDEQLLTQLERVMLVSPSGCRSRRSELVAAGWVQVVTDMDGQQVKRRGTGGTNRLVWEAVQPLNRGLW
jgi:integrase